MVQAVCRRFAGRAGDKRMHFSADIRPGVRVRGDQRLLEKVFTNVIGNAVAYSPAGADVRVELQPDRFFVENTGVHIAAEELERVFTPFYRVDKSRNRNHGGSGLGLYITKTILDRHGIRHSLENTPDGVRFTAFLPPAAPAAALPAEKDPAEPQHPKI